MVEILALILAAATFGVLVYLAKQDAKRWERAVDRD